MCDNRDRSDGPEHLAVGRRTPLRSTATGAAPVATGLVAGTARAADDPCAPPEKPALPLSDMSLDLERTALAVSDPQIDFLSPDGVTWDVAGASVQQHNTVENLGRLFTAAKKAGITVAISPHDYHPPRTTTIPPARDGGSRARWKS